MAKREVIINTYPFVMSKILKPGKIGRFELYHKLIKKGTILQLYSRRGRLFRGEYQFDYPIVSLDEDGDTWMTDSQLEVEAISGVVCAAKGDCLIGGLGIGLLPTLIKRKVKSIDIVELHQEVIDLVFNQIATNKMRIVKDDIYHYLDITDNQYDFIYIDIWEAITAPLKEIDKAREKAGRCLRDGGVIWCWLQELYDRIKDKLPKTPLEVAGLPAWYEPCLICGKELRNNYAGLCMDCADDMEVSELYVRR